jgi:hypothetical protein
LAISRTKPQSLQLSHDFSPQSTAKCASLPGCVSPGSARTNINKPTNLIEATTVTSSARLNGSAEIKTNGLSKTPLKANVSSFDDYDTFSVNVNSFKAEQGFESVTNDRQHHRRHQMNDLNPFQTRNMSAVISPSHKMGREDDLLERRANISR